MKFLSLVVLINLVLIKIFKINEVGIYMCVYIYIFVIIKHFWKQYYSWNFVLLANIRKTKCYLHTLLYSYFHIWPFSLHIILKQRSHSMKFKYALIFHEIQTCSHFSFVFRVSSFCNNLVFSLCHNQVHML